MCYDKERVKEVTHEGLAYFADYFNYTYCSTDRTVFPWKKAQKKQEAQKEQIDASKQQVSMLIIDKSDCR